MNHDPLCPVAWCCNDCYCECRLIRRVREDEASKYGSLRETQDAVNRARAAALRDAVEAVKALHSDRDGVDAGFRRAVAAIEALNGNSHEELRSRSDRAYDLGRLDGITIGTEATIRHAIAAVDSLPSANYLPHPGYTDDQPVLWREQVVAAIEALGGER